MKYNSILDGAAKIGTVVAFLGMAWGSVELISPALNRIQNPTKQELAMCDWYKNQASAECNKNPSCQDSCLEAVQRSYEACIERYGK